MTGFKRCKARTKENERCDREEGHDGPHWLGIIYVYHTWIDEKQDGEEQEEGES